MGLKKPNTVLSGFEHRLTASEEADIAYSPAPTARVTASGMAHAGFQRHVLEINRERLLVRQRGPTSGRMPAFKHGSAEAEESTRQTFLVYTIPERLANCIFRILAFYDRFV